MNELYINTKGISIVDILMIRCLYWASRVIYKIVQPKYYVNDLGVAIEIDLKNKTMKRIYPNPSEETAKITDTKSYINGYKNRIFYRRKIAIKLSMKLLKEK